MHRTLFCSIHFSGGSRCERRRRLPPLKRESERESERGGGPEPVNLILRRFGKGNSLEKVCLILVIVLGVFQVSFRGLFTPPPIFRFLQIHHWIQYDKNSNNQLHTINLYGKKKSKNKTRWFLFYSSISSWIDLRVNEYVTSLTWVIDWLIE